MRKKDATIFSEKELKRVIKEAMDEYFDPEYSFQFKKDFVKLLKKSKEEQERGELFSLDEIKKEVGLK